MIADLLGEDLQCNLHNKGFDYLYLLRYLSFSRIKLRDINYFIFFCQNYVSNYHHIILSQNVCRQIMCLE